MVNKAVLQLVDSVLYRQNINGNYKMRQNMQNQTISELYTNDKTSKYSSNCNNIVKSGKNFYEKFYTKETMSKTATVELFSKISNRNKISNKQLHHCKGNTFLEKKTKSINFQANFKPPGTDSLAAKSPIF